MTNPRESKARHIEVHGHFSVEDALPRWEAELVVAALTRLQCTPVAVEASTEVVSRSAEETTHAAR